MLCEGTNEVVALGVVLALMKCDGGLKSWSRARDAEKVNPVSVGNEKLLQYFTIFFRP